MRITALAIVVFALGIALGLAFRGRVAEAAPPWTTTQFVEDSIEAFNQAVVQPIANTVAQLQGAVSDLDQRVTALEAAGGSTPTIYLRSQQFGGGPGGTQTYSIYCDAGDVTVGGGFALHGAPISSHYIDTFAPVNETGQAGLAGWTARYYGTEITLSAICMDVP